MNSASRVGALLVITILGLPRLSAEPLPLKRAVELALAHSTTAAAANADQQRVFASYREARSQYIPQFVVGSGLGKSWGYPLSLEGSAPSIVNLNTQSALFNPALRDFVRAAKTDSNAATLQSKDQRNQVIQDTVLSYAELNKWEALLGHLQEEHAAALQTEQLESQRIKEEWTVRRCKTTPVWSRRGYAYGWLKPRARSMSSATGLPSDRAPGRHHRNRIRIDAAFARGEAGR